VSDIDARLAALGIVLPTPTAPVANYVAFVEDAGLLHVSGQLSRLGDEVVAGVVGVDVDLATAQQGARLCAINLIAQIRAACDGDFARFGRLVRLGAFVQAGPDLSEIPQVVNGASDLMVEAFGDAGRHARSAVGVYRLPLGVAVEVDAVVRLR
jgi:enamine deaminase RidA (YjgF/YER057c/UK114 family)